MKRLLAFVALAIAELCSAQTVTPVVIPHQTFTDNAGLPCALCKLYSYSAGTTTPLATYTDSTGGTQNSNPIVLDIAGGANIWVSNTLAYKFVLKDALGSTIWTVDNVKATGGSVPCTTPYAVQFANSDHTALACDSTITVDPVAHSLNVGGAITGPAFTLKNLGTIPANWTLDVTTPTTALNSLGAIPLVNLATQDADSVVMNATGGTAAPTAVPLPSGCALGLNYDTTAHAWTCAATTIPLGNLATQGANTVVMNASDGVSVPWAAPLPTGCTYGVNYSTATHTWTCTVNPTYNPTDHDVTFSRSFGTVYQNTGSAPIRIYGYGSTTGSSVGSVSVSIGSVSPSSTTYVNTCAATVGGGGCGFVGEVPAGWFYTVAANSFSGGSHAVSGVGSWHEVY